MSNTAEAAATTFDARIRAALAELTRMRGNRCGDGDLDAAAPWTTALAPPFYTRDAQQLASTTA
jgi:hypothetical protein